MQLLKPSRLNLANILLVTGAPPWEDLSVAYAKELAQSHGARVQIAHLLPATLHRKIAELRARQGDAVANNSPVRPHAPALLDHSSLEHKLLEMTETQAFDLAIASSKKPRPGEKPSLGQAVEQTLWVADAPVLVFGPSVVEGASGTRPHTIVHAIDFSPQAIAAGEHALSWAQEHLAWLTMLHVVEGIHPRDESERAALVKPFRRWMEELVPAETSLWCEVEHRIDFGDAADAIVAAAREMEAGLIVIGLSGLDGAADREVGGAARKVMLEAPCPVLVVRDSMVKRTAVPEAKLRTQNIAVPLAA
ncbi:MAG TPA: universal stress protein [Terriglobales bacterium]|nr:universal stress protein [Terriglobales bacterium]